MLFDHNWLVPEVFEADKLMIFRGFIGFLVQKAAKYPRPHKQKKSVKIAQKIAGHVNPSTTLIYEEPPEEMIEDALKNLSPTNGHN